MEKSLIAASMLLAGAVSANDVTIDISGELAPTSCTLGLARGTVNLGNIPTASLAGGHEVSWDAAAAPQVTITCTGDTLVAFSLTDNRADTLGALAADTAFGIGRFTNGAEGNPIGTLALSLDNVEVEDGTGVVAEGDLIRFENGLADPSVVDAEPVLRKAVAGFPLYSFAAIESDGARRLAFDLLGTLTLQDSDQIAEGFAEVAHTIDGNFTVTAHF